MKSQEDFAKLVAAQNEIIEHWQSARAGRRLPGRADINPGALKAHLGSISILELDGQGAARFRLVGTRLRERLGSEMRGCALEDASDEAARIWRTGLADACRLERPVFGIEDLGKEQHAWLRLPLASETPDGKQLVLCHDVLKRTASREPSHFLSRLPHLLGPVAA